VFKLYGKLIFIFPAHAMSASHKRGTPVHESNAADLRDVRIRFNVIVVHAEGIAAARL
jgi:hypothetical protein